MVRKFECIQGYPGTGKGSVVEYSEKTLNFIDTFNDKIYDFSDIVFSPEYWQELRTIDSLIFEAKQRYPVGYKIKILVEDDYVIKETDNIITAGNGSIIVLETQKGDFKLYSNKKWLIW